MRRTLIRACLLLLLVLAGQSAVWAQKKTLPPASDRENGRRSFAQNLARAINAAEADYLKKHGAYAGWDTLFGLGEFSSTGKNWSWEEFPAVAHALYGGGPEIVPGWRLRLQLSKGDKAYDVMIEDVNDPKCGYAVMTDERGLIRQGKSIDCPP